MTTAIVLRNAEVAGRHVDVTWIDGVVRDVTPARDTVRRPTTTENDVIDAAGGALIPGLHDHHIHLHALAAARASIAAGPPDVTNESGLAAALKTAVSAEPGTWVRAVGYHESVAGVLDAPELDRLVPSAESTPIRIQHRSGQLWILNEHAIERVGLSGWTNDGVERDRHGEPTGRVFGLDTELRARIPPLRLDFQALGRELADYGVTGATDMTPIVSSAAVEQLARETELAGFPVRVTISGGPRLDPCAARMLERGPVKLLPPDHQDPDLDAVAGGIAQAHAVDRAAAIHCVTRVGLVAALEAWRRAGVRPGDRIEHGAVIPDELIDVVRDLGLLVVTQPNFVAERGDQYLDEVDADDQPHLWRCRTLTERGVRVVGGTDAPFGHPDPWRAIAAAMHRTTPLGAVLGPDDRLAARDALALFLGCADRPTRVRGIRPGVRTDLCLLDRPLDAALTDPRSEFVRLTIGRHRSER